MTSDRPDLLSVLAERLGRDPGVKSVVLYGSRARPTDGILAADVLSDVDLHVIAGINSNIGKDRWIQSLRGLDFCLRVIRPSPGAVRKITLHFTSGEADLVLLPESLMRATRIALRFHIHLRFPPLARALNNMSTMMKDGYRFIKGEKAWGEFYACVAEKLPGCRLDDREAVRLANFFLSDLRLVLRLIDRGELIAAQRMIHKSLVETNLLLQHELRLRKGQVARLQGRLAERLLNRNDLAAVYVSARIDADELCKAACRTYEGLRRQMSELVPEWQTPTTYEQLLKFSPIEGKNPGPTL